MIVVFSAVVTTSMVIAVAPASFMRRLRRFGGR
jgi:hypothetical protein